MQAVFIPGQLVDVVTRRIAAVVQRLCRANPRITVLLASPIPYCAFWNGSIAQRATDRTNRRAAEKELKQGLDALCVDRSGSCKEANIVCVDLSTRVRCDHLVADGVHPSNVGAARMAASWFSALAPLLPSPSDDGISA